VAPKALSSCKKCHALGPIAPQSSAPSLWQIWGRKIAADGGFEYSDSLAGAQRGLGRAGAPGLPLRRRGVRPGRLDARPGAQRRRARRGDRGVRAPAV